MIRLTDVSKAYPTPLGVRNVLTGINLEIPPNQNLGILGRNGAGKSTLLRLLAGVEQPDAGTIERYGRISWPIGFGGGFNGSLSGEDNCRFVARLYGEPVDEVCAFTYDFSELAEYFFMPVRTYSSGMRARLAFGLSMAIDFGYYLVDEVTAVGDKAFQQKCRAAFREREERSGVIIVSHNLQTVRNYCKHCAVLIDGHLHVFDTVRAAAQVYQAACPPQPTMQRAS